MLQNTSADLKKRQYYQCLLHNTTSNEVVSRKVCFPSHRDPSLRQSFMESNKTLGVSRTIRNFYRNQNTIITASYHCDIGEPNNDHENGSPSAN
jgi:hypothetical protein